jgi:hypothetical protein
MQSPFRSHILPRFPIFAGLLGLILRVWLFASVDEKGLLPAGHFADRALFVLSAVVIVVVFLSTRTLLPRRLHRFAIRNTNVSTYIAGGLGFILNAVFILVKSSVRLVLVATTASLLGGIIMLVIAYRFKANKRISYLLLAAVTVVLMLDTIAQCQVWGALPQFQEYFFPLMASVFLVLSTHQRTLFSARRPNPKLLAFFSQTAVFFCIVSLNSSHWILYLGMLFWAAAQIYPCTAMKKKV